METAPSATPEASAAAPVQPFTAPVVEASTPSEKYRVKVDGKEAFVTVEELTKDYELRRASQERLNRASALRKEVDEFLDTVRAGDFSHLKGIVPEDALVKFAEDTLREKLAWENKSEDERNRIKAEQERDKYKREYEELTKKEQEKVLQEQQMRAHEQVDQEVADAIADLTRENPGLKVTPALVQRIALEMLTQLSDENVTDARKATVRSYTQYKQDIKQFLGSLSAKEIRGLLNKDQLTFLRKQDLEDAYSQLANPISKTPGEPRKKGKEKLGVNDFFSYMDKKLGA